MKEDFEKNNFEELVRLMALSKDRRDEEERTKRKVIVTPKYIGEDTTEKPKFTNQLIYKLFEYGIDIPEGILNEIKQAERTSLISDLNKIVYDGITGFKHYFTVEIPEENTEHSVIHALFLLRDIEAEESLEVILDFLSQDEELLVYWLGDLLCEEIWSVIAICGKNNLPRLSAFMKESGIYTYSKSEVSEVVSQLVLHKLLDRATAINWFEDVFTYFLNNSQSENIIDSDLNGLMMCACIDLRAIELLPTIEKMFDANLVTGSIAGDWVEVQEAIKQPLNTYNSLREIKDINVLYTELQSNPDDEPYGDDGGAFDAYEPVDSAKIETFIRTEPKIGRNDPCVCGSGKKYKKCCGTKS
ncbi:MAG: DUF1186 domain-containing protein [Bacteroidia bacterium]